MSQSKKPAYKAFFVKQYGEGKEHWTEIGAVWRNKADGFTLDIVEALAVSGRVVILPPWQEAEEA